MPPRLALTPEQAVAELERRRALASARQQRWRERRRVASTATSTFARVTSTPGPGTAAVDATPPAPPVSQSFSLLERRKIEHLLSTFADRGYRHDPRFWELLRARYPHLDLELEVLKLAEWLDEPRNAKRKCSKGFISNWLSKADVDRQQREAQARTLPPQGSSVPIPGSVPPGGVKNPGPPPVLPVGVTLERIDPAVASRHLLDAKRLTLDEKLALAKNGRH